MRIYLAGPEVFLPDALEILAEKARIARLFGFEPLAPLDNELEPRQSPHAMGMAIYRSNVALMNGCDAILANLTPFRGISADPGTCFELGYMAARGARVAAYSNDPRGYAMRARDEYYQGAVVSDASGEYGRPDGLSIENFDMFDNLMLHGAAEDGNGVLAVAREGLVLEPDRLYRDMETFERCLEALRRRLKEERTEISGRGSP